jgi:hypothetical protein
MTFRTTFPFRTPKSEGVRNGLHDGKQDVRKGWYETSFTRKYCRRIKGYELELEFCALFEYELRNVAQVFVQE